VEERTLGSLAVAVSRTFSYCSIATVHTCSIDVKQMSPGQPSQTLSERCPDLCEVDLLSVLQALSDPVRLEIVRQLDAAAGTDGLKCNQLKLPVGKSTGSHHLRTLTEAGVTAEREEGTSKYIWLRRAELEERFPGLIGSVLDAANAG
jgi:DNA-binding transcriptional ArsR family regulator